MNKTRAALLIMTLISTVFGLLLVISGTDSENVVTTTLHFVSGFVSDSKHYEPVISFKDKYPDYIVLKQSKYPRGDTYAQIVYAYTNSSLYRTEVLSVSGSLENPSFSIKCIDENREIFGTQSANLQYFTKQFVDDFRCADYKINSNVLEELHATKKILDHSNFPIKKIDYNYDKQLLEIRLFTLPRDNYEEKINAILLENNVNATIEYQGYGIGTFS